jgi:hypothetical protein
MSNSKRFGSMLSNRVGKCHFCETVMQIGEVCAYDNVVKARVCRGCAEQTSGVALPQPAPKNATTGQPAASGELYDRVRELEARLDELENTTRRILAIIENQHKDIEATLKSSRFNEALYQALRRVVAQLVAGGVELLPHELASFEIAVPPSKPQA